MTIQANVSALDVADQQHCKGDPESDKRLGNPSNDASDDQRPMEIGGIQLVPSGHAPPCGV